MLYAETYIAMKSVEEAREILKAIPIQDRDSRWHGLQAQIELLEQASESPELQQLQADYANSKTLKLRLNWQISYTKLIKMKKHSRYFLIG